MATFASIKGFLKALPAVIGMGLVALFFIVKGQRDAARDKGQQAKEKLASVKKVRQTENDMATNLTEARDESKDEARRQEAYRRSGERPDYFGDDRLR